MFEKMSRYFFVLYKHDEAKSHGRLVLQIVVVFWLSFHFIASSYFVNLHLNCSVLFGSVLLHF